MEYRYFMPFKEWCYFNKHCTKEMYDSIDRENSESIAEYQDKKRSFYEAMIVHSDDYSKALVAEVEEEMLNHEKDSLIYEALTYMLDEFKSKH